MIFQCMDGEAPQAAAAAVCACLRLRDHDGTYEKRGGRKEVEVRRVSNCGTVPRNFGQADGASLSQSFPLELFGDL